MNADSSKLRIPEIRNRLRGLNSPATVAVVRFLAILLITLLLPLSLTTTSAIACSTTECCGTSCSQSTPVDQLSCCQISPAPDRAANPEGVAQHFDSVASMPTAAVVVAISHLQSAVIARGYSPPDRLASLALLCSRQI
jgi:hypothetical protein